MDTRDRPHSCHPFAPYTQLGMVDAAAASVGEMEKAMVEHQFPHAAKALGGAAPAGLACSTAP